MDPALAECGCMAFPTTSSTPSSETTSTSSRWPITPGVPATGATGYDLRAMKNRIDAILKLSQAEYLDSLLPPRDALLARVEAFAAEHGHPIADPEVAQLMRVLLRAKKPRRVIEVGTNIGYSVIVMGRECGSEATIETIEIDRGTLAVARDFVAEADLPGMVIFHEGAALEVIPKLAGPFDFVFIDCVKTEYGDYLDSLLPKLERGAMIVCDNLLWGGKVAEGIHDPSTDALRGFNRRIVTDPQLLTTILPVGDGTGVSIVL
jgi:predicted O-methyltransferase YrrM